MAAGDCYAHPGVPGGARCGTCGRAMCHPCFDRAPWPRKLCADCTAAPPSEPLRAPPAPVAWHRPSGGSVAGDGGSRLAGSVMVLLAACLITAVLLPIELDLPHWVEAEAVLAAWWVVWVLILADVLFRGRRLGQLRQRLSTDDGEGDVIDDALSFASADWASAAEGGVVGLIAGLLLALLLTFALGPLIAIIPALIGGVYFLIVRLIAQAVRARRRTRRHPLRSLAVAVQWATIYTAPLAVAVWAFHSLARL